MQPRVSNDAFQNVTPIKDNREHSPFCYPVYQELKYCKLTLSRCGEICIKIISTIYTDVLQNSSKKKFNIIMLKNFRLLESDRITKLTFHCVHFDFHAAVGRGKRDKCADDLFTT